MESAGELPHIAFARVCTAGEPYAVDDVVCIAFNTPGVGRLASPARQARDEARRNGVVPESITAEITVAGGPYAVGDRVTLSFVDPSVARIHPSETRGASAARTNGFAEPGPRAATRTEREPSIRNSDGERSGTSFAAATSAEASLPEDEMLLVAVAGLESAPAVRASPDAETALALTRLTQDWEPPVASPAGVRVTLSWSLERAQRFVRVVDKLFTVDRLGWYRHVLAVRLLVPDEIATGDAPADVEAGRQLLALRTAVAETLGRPLLAACMPNFCITTEWLDELDSVGAARASGALREAMLPYVDDDATIGAVELVAGRTIGVVTRRELLASPTASVEALLPVLVPCLSPLLPLAEKLADYRSALIDGFGQTAGSAKAVRLGAMSQSNHALDDRLWQLVGAVGESFGGLASP